MRRLALCIFLSLLLAVTASAVSVPEMPEEIYVLDMAEVLDERTERAIVKRGDALFAVTGAQLVIVTAETDDPRALAEAILEEWYLGSAERNNGVVFVTDGDTGSIGCAYGVGLADFFSKRSADSYGEDEYLSELEEKGDRDSAVLRLYNAIYSDLQDYYSINAEYWDGVTYLYSKRYDTTVRDVVIGCGIIAFVGLVVWNEVRRRHVLKQIEGEPEREDGEPSPGEIEISQINEENTWKYN